MTQQTPRRKPAKRKLTLLEQAAECVWRKIDNLSDSAPMGTLNRLHDLAHELEDIEASL